MSSDRHGFGIAVPLTVGSTDLILVRGNDLLASAVLMSLSIHRGELRYDTTKGSRLRELKHRHFPGTTGDAVATSLVSEVLTREEPAIQVSPAEVDRDKDEFKVLVSYTEKSYDGADSRRTVTLEV